MTVNNWVLRGFTSANQSANSARTAPASAAAAVRSRMVSGTERGASGPAAVASTTAESSAALLPTEL
ncbi:hypothetical protein AHiyo8_37950 [Arthrobacter sp. Hiyo8]|nr:hypothetical protein AHiyo8_37950 [Arthrobacter sp. Hiyo8]